MLKRFMKLVDGGDELSDDSLKKMDQYIDPNSIFDEKCIMEAKELGIPLNELRAYRQGNGCKPIVLMDFAELKELVQKERIKLSEEDDEQRKEIIESKIECLEYELRKKIRDIM